MQYKGCNMRQCTKRLQLHKSYEIEAADMGTNKIHSNKCGHISHCLSLSVVHRCLSLSVVHRYLSLSVVHHYLSLSVVHCCLSLSVVHRYLSLSVVHRLTVSSQLQCLFLICLVIPHCFYLKSHVPAWGLQSSVHISHH